VKHPVYIYKDDFEAVVIREINKVPSDSIVTCCHFHFSQCLWRQLQNIDLTLLNKEHEQVKIYAAVTCQPINKVQEE
jgi:hypothetical protein